ncbi:hypothetical protein PQX77_015806 [Marasmius sp. AFHP31]|nr:hypothetical protein PQX77_015806 [Marasmius sp. AFHP31]
MGIPVIPNGYTFNFYSLDIGDTRPTPSIVRPMSHIINVGAATGGSIAAVIALLAIVVFLLRNHNRKRKEMQRHADSTVPTITRTRFFEILESRELTCSSQKAFELYQFPSKSKPIAEAEASSVSLPPVPPPTPTTITLALGLDPTPIPPPPTRNVPGSLLSGNTNGTALPSYKSRVATLPPIPDLPLPPPYASVRSRVS